jgi:hypothetical protein
VRFRVFYFSHCDRQQRRRGAQSGHRISAPAIFEATAGLARPGEPSVNAYDPGENIIDYAATKGAIMIFTKG